MGATVVIRTDVDAAVLRHLARRERDGRVSSRLMARANMLDGMSREAAARSAGMDWQTLRNWVIRFNAESIEGLRDQPRSGRPTRMTEMVLTGETEPARAQVFWHGNHPTP